MQFREQGQKIQCVRATYDTGAKRTHQKVIATFDRYADQVPSAGLETLTAAEMVQLTGWFENRKAAMKVAQNDDRIVGATVKLADLVEAINENGIDSDRADKILASLDLVKKAIKKALDGKTVKPPRKSKATSKPAQVDPRQQPLLGAEPAATTP